jgi:DNA polymerase elongation subunit (family B)
MRENQRDNQEWTIHTGITRHRKKTNKTQQHNTTQQKIKERTTRTPQKTGGEPTGGEPSEG